MAGCLPDSLAASGNNGDFVFEFHGSSVAVKCGPDQSSTFRVAGMSCLSPSGVQSCYASHCMTG